MVGSESERVTLFPQDVLLGQTGGRTVVGRATGAGDGGGEASFTYTEYEEMVGGTTMSRCPQVVDLWVGSSGLQTQTGSHETLISLSHLEQSRIM